MVVKSETLPLPLFLRNIKINTESVINSLWIVTDKKPNRTFESAFSEKDTKQWIEEKYRFRSTTKGKKGKDKVSFKIYKMILIYEEKSLTIEANVHLKRKINNGRWTKSRC
eukprot:38342_1